MKLFYVVLGILVFLSSCDTVSKKDYNDPAALWGDLYKEVQKERIFENPKEFWDASPVLDADKVLEFYRVAKEEKNFDLRAFLKGHFVMPDYSQAYKTSEEPFEKYVVNSFRELYTKPKDDKGSLIPTRMWNVSGGGMFQEYNYFRSFFAVKAYQALGEDSVATNLATNCFQFIQDFGYVPYGNRSYYLGYSGVPILGFMAEAVSEKQPDFLPWFGNLMGRDYQGWLSLRDDTEKKEQAERKGDYYKTVWFVGKDQGLAKYYASLKSTPYFSLEKATEWGGSPRFSQGLENYVPIDLNALIYGMETMLSRSFDAKGRPEYAASYKNLSDIRKSLVNEYLYNREDGFYYDYDFKLKSQSSTATLAGVFPLVAGMSSKEQAVAVARKLEKEFLTPNGLVNVLGGNSGSAEMNYMAILALRKTGHDALADVVKQRWIAMNKAYFVQHKHILPSYDLDKPLETAKTPQRIDGALAVLIALLNEK